MSAPTPGPWVVGKYNRAAVMANGERVADCHNADIGDEELDRANARLIAAAPLLLEACKHAVRYLEERGRYDTADVVAPILAAIAAAEGE
jgi:hypothetical protein